MSIIYKEHSPYQDLLYEHTNHDLVKSETKSICPFIDA